MGENKSVDKESDATNASSTNDEKPNLTKFGKFCLRRGINKNLIMLKITLFVMYGATSSLLPYLTIHMQSIGLTVEEIAIIYLALPFTTFLSPPITGFLVDKFGKYKPVVVMSLLLNALFHHSLLMIPQQEIPGQVPAAYVIRHPQTGNVEVWWSPCPSRECPEEEEIDIIVDQCLDHCLLLEQNPKIEIVPPPTKTPILPADLSSGGDDLNMHVSKRKSNGNGGNDGGGTTGGTPSPPLSNGQRNRNSTLQLKNIKPIGGNLTRSTNHTRHGGNSSITSSSNLTFFDDDLGFNNTEEESGESWVVNSEETAFFLLDMHPDLGEPIEQLGIEVEHDDNETVTDFKSRFGVKLLWDSGVNVTQLEEEDLRCGGLSIQSNMSSNNLNDQISKLAADCMVQKCRFRMGGPEICPPDYIESDDRTFWIYFLLRFLATTMLSAGVTIMDPIALTMIEKYGGDFGRERLFSSIGMAIFSPITGILIDYTSRGLGYTDYSAAFYTYDILLIISTITVLLMPLGEKLPQDNVFKDLFNLLKMPHVMAFIVFLFILGNFWGFIESFLFLYLKELGAPNYLLGITITVGTVSSIPFLYGAERITRIFGHVNLIIVAFFSHAGRLVGYSFIESAWWCFPFEAMEALSCHLMWVAAATYCSILAPKNLLATLIGVLGMAHFSLGRGSGSFCGGLLIAEVGTREAFRYMGLLAVVGGICYGLLHVLWLRKFDHKFKTTAEEAADAEQEKLTGEPRFKDQGTTMSQERLSLMIKYNQIGSLTSLPRGSRVDVNDGMRRRSSYQIEYVKQGTKGGSASKVDLLKSALEINHKSSNNSVLSKHEKISNQSLDDKTRSDSAPKLNHTKNISHPALSVVVDETPELSLTYEKKKLFKSGTHLASIPAIELGFRYNSMSDNLESDRRDSIPEEREEPDKKKIFHPSTIIEGEVIGPSIGGISTLGSLTKTNEQINKSFKSHVKMPHEEET